MSAARTRSILLQVMAPSLALIVLAFAAVGGFTAWSRASGAAELFRRKVELSASLSQPSASNGLWLVDQGALREALEPILRDPDQRLVMVLDDRGGVFLSSGEADLKRPAMTLLAQAGKLSGPRIVRQGRYLFSMAPLRHEEAGGVIPLGAMVIAYDTRSVGEEVWAGVASTVAITMVAIGLFALLLVMLLRRITRPLHSLSRAMNALSSGDLATRIEGLERHDEIGLMARAVQVFKVNALRLKASEREGERLQAARLRAEAANQAKREFLAHMSHELRTPLNGVLTMADLMSLDRLEDEQRAKLDIIRRSGQELLYVINDILDFSKIEAGKLELESIVFDVEQVFADAHAAFAATAARKGLKLRLEVEAAARGLRRGDPVRLRQILNNYVSNALKFTAEGEVAILVSPAGETGLEGLTVAVRDTGIGVPADKMPLLFQSFTQVDASTTRQFGGTGLGLAICRELAALMGGRVWAESREGEGTSFYATLMLPWVGEAAEGPETQAEPIRKSAHARPLRVLAAEDNATNQVVLSTLMEAFGFELHVAGNGREAVEAWKRGGFDLILMDVQMPGMDGLEATRLIRAAEADGGLARIPIVALTANAFRHQIEEYAAAGMDDHLAKPIELHRLQQVLERSVARIEAEAERGVMAK